MVDAAQGVEAQTLANCYLAVEHDLEIIPVVNKVDLPAADPDRCAEEIEDVIGLDARGCLSRPRPARASPRSSRPSSSAFRRPTATDAPLQALIFDAGTTATAASCLHVRVIDGTLRKGDRSA